MPGRYIIGLDAGTTSIKGILVDPIDGEVLVSAGKEYSLETKGNICEIDPEIYWESTLDVIHQLLSKLAISGKDILSLAFSSQGETLICLGANGRPLRKAIVWLDNRSVNEAGEIENHFGSDRAAEITGQNEIVPIWPATRILWLKKNEKKVFKQTHKFLLVEDYLIYRLTGKYCSEESLVSSTLYYDITNKVWWKDMLDYLSITEEQLPDVYPSGRIIGNLSPEASELTRLSENCIVVSGAYDHAAGAIGSGNIRQGMISETTGASMAMVVTLDNPIISKKLNLPCQCHAVEDKYLLLPYGQTAGMVLRWFRDKFCQAEMLEAQSSGKDTYEILTEMANSIEPGSAGLVVIPHLMGAGTPEFDPDAKGIFYGVTLEMNKAHFVRAIMESISCMVRNNLETLNKFGINTEEIRCTGGASKSHLWNQIKADCSGVNIITPENDETASLGAAILAGVGTNVFKNIKEGCEKMVKNKHTYVPDNKNKKVYDLVFEKYKRLYAQTKSLQT